MSDNKIILFVGLGNMGSGMAMNLAKAGHRVMAYDLNPLAMDKAAERGCEAVLDLNAALKGAEVVITMLPAGPHVRGFYGDTVLNYARPETLLIDCSTIDVDSARHVAEAAKAKGFSFADAPVSGGTAAAEGGTLAFMVGASEAYYPKVEQLLKPMARAVFRAGDVGAGQAAKICNNMLLGISMAGLCETVALAERLGLSPETFYDISSVSSGQCWSMTSYYPWPGPVPNAPSNRNFEGGFAGAMMLKDLKLAQEASAKAGATTPMGAAAESLYALYERLGFGGTDFSGLLHLMRGELEKLKA